MSDHGNTNWDGIPNTDNKATCVSHRHVVDVMVITVENAQIRSSTVSGTFEVADVPNPFRLDDFAGAGGGTSATLDTSDSTIDCTCL